MERLPTELAIAQQVRDFMGLKLGDREQALIVGVAPDQPPRVSLGLA